MASGFIERVLEWLGFEAQEAAAGEGERVPPSGGGGRGWARGRRGRVVPLNPPGTPSASPEGGGLPQVVVAQPRSLEDVQTIAAHLKADRPVLVTLRQADREAARRIIDFLSGAVYALDGTMRAVGDDIVLCTPNRVDVKLEGWAEP